jgi:hypothetical protein
MCKRIMCWTLPGQILVALFLCLRIPTNYVTLLGVFYEVTKTLYGQITSIRPSVICP